MLPILLCNASIFSAILAAESLILTVTNFATIAESVATCFASKVTRLPSVVEMLAIWSILVFKASILLAIPLALSMMSTLSSNSTTSAPASNWVADRVTVLPSATVMLAMLGWLLCKLSRLMAILAAVSLTATFDSLATTPASLVTWVAVKVTVPLVTLIEPMLLILLCKLSILEAIFVAVSLILTVPSLATTAVPAENWVVVRATAVAGLTVKVSILPILELIALKFEAIFCAVSLTVILAALPSFVRTAALEVTWLAVKVTALVAESLTVMDWMYLMPVLSEARLLWTSLAVPETATPGLVPIFAKMPASVDTCDGEKVTVPDPDVTVMVLMRESFACNWSKLRDMFSAVSVNV